MAQLTKEQVEEFKKIAKETRGIELTDKEAWEQANNLVNFFKLLYECDMEERNWKRRLEKEPKGFPMKDSGRNCCVCHVSTSPENSWYDKHGIKCLNCQRALDKKVIPVSITKYENRNKTWFTAYDLQSQLKNSPNDHEKVD